MSDSPDAIRTVPKPTCYLCGRPGAVLYEGLRDRLYDVPGEWSLRRCDGPDCGLVWLDPWPVVEDIPKLYRSYYTHGNRDGAVARAYRWLCRGVLAARLGYAPLGPLNRLAGAALARVGVVRDALLGSALWQPASVGRLLDVGCGSGSFLRWMRDLGWRVEGVEPDPAAGAVARESGIAVRTGTLEQAEFADNQFDVVTLSHVIEHLPDPIATLAECYRILKPGGRVVVVTPNVEGHGAREFGRHWLHLDPPRHFVLFRRTTLCRAAKVAGYRDIRAFTVARVAWLTHRASTRIRTHGALSGGRCPFEPWRVPQALAFQARQHSRCARRMDGEELVLLARKVELAS